MLTTDLVAPARISPTSTRLSPGGAPSDAHARVTAEYLEMPAMTLTVRQAARLWSLPLSLTAQLLDDLVGSGFLVRTHDDRYRRPGCPRCA
ncbi:MAG: hypothetical protein KGN76_08080 [Acidobacteriota bacterium]|nr:hypothetical protein [Acidobacteriota bacterium]